LATAPFIALKGFIYKKQRLLKSFSKFRYFQILEQPHNKKALHKRKGLE